MQEARERRRRRRKPAYWLRSWGGPSCFSSILESNEVKGVKVSGSRMRTGWIVGHSNLWHVDAESCCSPTRSSVYVERRRESLTKKCLLSNEHHAVRKKNVMASEVERDMVRLDFPRLYVKKKSLSGSDNTCHLTFEHAHVYSDVKCRLVCQFHVS